MSDPGSTDPHIAIDPATRLALHQEPTGDELVAAVLADPHADDPRLVYGDYLIERGDPRGELIQLQLARHRTGEPASAHERELLAAHGTAWAEPLTAALDPASVVFERGFVARARTLPSLALRDLIGHPMWATVEALDSQELGLIVSPCMRGLRSLHSSDDNLAWLSRGTHAIGLVRAELRLARRSGGVPRFEVDLGGRTWRDILAVGALTELRALALETEVAPEVDSPFSRAVLESPLGAQLTSLEIAADDVADLPRWADVVRTHPSIARIAVRVRPRPRRFGEDPREPRVAIARAAGGNLAVSLELDDVRVPRDVTLRVLASVARLAGGTLTVTHRGQDPARDGELLAELRARVAPLFGSLSVRRAALASLS